MRVISASSIAASARSCSFFSVSRRSLSRRSFRRRSMAASHESASAGIGARDTMPEATIGDDTAARGLPVGPECDLVEAVAPLPAVPAPGLVGDCARFHTAAVPPADAELAFSLMATSADTMLCGSGFVSASTPGPWLSPKLPNSYLWTTFPLSVSSTTSASLSALDRDMALDRRGVLP